MCEEKLKRCNRFPPVKDLLFLFFSAFFVFSFFSWLFASPASAAYPAWETGVELSAMTGGTTTIDFSDDWGGNAIATVSESGETDELKFNVRARVSCSGTLTLRPRVFYCSGYQNTGNASYKTLTGCGAPVEGADVLWSPQEFGGSGVWLSLVLPQLRYPKDSYLVVQTRAIEETGNCDFEYFSGFSGGSFPTDDYAYLLTNDDYLATASARNMKLYVNQPPIAYRQLYDDGAGVLSFTWYEYTEHNFDSLQATLASGGRDVWAGEIFANDPPDNFGVADITFGNFSSGRYELSAATYLDGVPTGDDFVVSHDLVNGSLSSDDFVVTVEYPPFGKTISPETWAATEPTPYQILWKTNQIAAMSGELVTLDWYVATSGGICSKTETRSISNTLDGVHIGGVLSVPYACAPDGFSPVLGEYDVNIDVSFRGLSASASGEFIVGEYDDMSDTGVCELGGFLNDILCSIFGAADSVFGVSAATVARFKNILDVSTYEGAIPSAVSSMKTAPSISVPVSDSVEYDGLTVIGIGDGIQKFRSVFVLSDQMEDLIISVLYILTMCVLVVSGFALFKPDVSTY